MANLACDLLCQSMRRMRQHFASVCGACGSTLLAYAAHTVANCYRMHRIRQQNHVKMRFLQAYVVANCQRMRHMRQHFASICDSCRSNLLEQTVHTLENCQHKRRIRQHFASLDVACGSKNKRLYMIHILYSGIDSYTLIHIFKPIHTYYTY